MINASVCWLKKVKLGEISPERNKAELCPGCWLAILLSLFFYCMRSDEWNPYNRYQGDSEKNGDRASKEQLCPNLSPFYNCSRSYSSSYVLHKLTQSPLITSLSQPLPSIFLSAFLLSRSSRPFSPSPSPRFALSEPIYRQSLMHFRHSHQSRFCFTAERSRPSFWLHINCSVGTDQDC